MADEEAGGNAAPNEEAGGNAALQERRIDEAAQDFSDPLEGDDNYLFYCKRSKERAQMAAQLYKDALADAAKTIQLKSDWAEGYSCLGAAHLVVGDAASAVDAYNRGLTIDPGNEDLKVGLAGAKKARAAETTNDMFKPTNFWKKIQGCPETKHFVGVPHVMTVLKQLQLNPELADDPSYRSDEIVIKALNALHMKDSDLPSSGVKNNKDRQAKKIAKIEREAQLSEEILQQNDYSHKEKEEGLECFKKREFGSAIQHFSEALQIGENDIFLLTNRAKAYYEIAKYHDSIQDCDKALQMESEAQASPEFVSSALTTKAKSLSRLANKPGDFDNIIMILDKALTMHSCPSTIKALNQARSARTNLVKQEIHREQLANKARGKEIAAVPVCKVCEKQDMIHLFVEDEKLGETHYLRGRLKNKERLTVVEIPGSKTFESIQVSSELCRLIIEAIVHFVFVLHAIGWSFGGRLTEKSFVFTHTGDLLASIHMFELLELLTDANEESDWVSVALLIRDTIFSSLPLPPYIESLVLLLEKFQRENRRAIIEHPAKLNEFDAMAQFEQLYNEFLQSLKTDQEMVQRILLKIPYCELTDEHWKLKARGNHYLEKTLFHQFKGSIGLSTVSHSDLYQMCRAVDAEPDLLQFVEEERKIDFRGMKDRIDLNQGDKLKKIPDKSTDRAVFFKIAIDDLRVSYPDGADFLVKNVRNNDQHLVESHSVGEGLKKLFKYKQVHHIIGCSYPMFRTSFFLAMNDEGLLPMQNKKLSDLLPGVQKAMMKVQAASKVPEPEPVEMNDEDKKVAAQKEKEAGNAAYEKKDFGTAFQHFTKAIELDDGDISYLTNRADVYLEMGLLVECIEECDMAVERGRELSADSKMILRAQTRKKVALAKLKETGQSYAGP